MQTLRPGLYPLGTDGLFTIAARISIAPPGYGAGESSAAINATNGKGGQADPLAAARHGARRRRVPTPVQNVETLTNVRRIARDGARALRAIGSADYPGAVARPGVYEVPSAAARRGASR